MDTDSQFIVDWPIAEHMRTELVTEALGMAIIRCQLDLKNDENQTIRH